MLTIFQKVSLTNYVADKEVQSLENVQSASLSYQTTLYLQTNALEALIIIFMRMLIRSVHNIQKVISISFTLA